MIADTNQHDIDLIVIGNARDIGKKSSVAGVIDCRAVAKANDKSGRSARVDWCRIFILLHGGSMPRRNKANRHFTIE